MSTVSKAILITFVVIAISWSILFIGVVVYYTGWESGFEDGKNYVPESMKAFTKKDNLSVDSVEITIQNIHSNMLGKCFKVCGIIKEK